MLKPLLRVQYRALLASFSGKRRGRAQRKGGMASYALLMLYAAMFMFLFFTSFSQLAAAFAPLGLGWLYWTMYIILAFALMFIGSVFAAKAQLFEAKDNELLLAMPIRPRDILLSRMALLLILNLVFELLVALPAGIAWVLHGAASAAGMCAFLLLLAALPLLSMAATSLFAWLISLITARLRKKTFVTMVLSIALFGVYFVVCFRLNSYITLLAANGQQIAGKLISVVPLYWMGSALGGELRDLAPALLVCLAPFGLACWLLSRSFIRIVTQKRGSARVRYHGKALPVHSDDGALLLRELHHLMNSASYMMNAGLGLIFYVVLAVFAVWKRQDAVRLTAQLGFTSGDVAVALSAAFALLAAMILFTASSVSLEGKNYWIVRSFPVKTKQILNAKLRLHNLLTLPVAGVCAAAVAAAYFLSSGDRGSAALGVLLVFGAMTSAELVAVLGLVANLRHANLNWVNETQPVRQGTAVLITMLIGWAIALVIGLPYLFWLRGAVSAAVYLLVAVVLMQAAAMLGERWIDTRGVKRFEALD